MKCILADLHNLLTAFSVLAIEFVTKRVGVLEEATQYPDFQYLHHPFRVIVQLEDSEISVHLLQCPLPFSSTSKCKSKSEEQPFAVSTRRESAGALAVISGKQSSAPHSNSSSIQIGICSVRFLLPRLDSGPKGQSAEHLLHPYTNQHRYGR